MALTQIEIQQYYKHHNLNKKSLENAIGLIKTNIKDCYKTEKENQYIIKLPFNNKERIKLNDNLRSYNRILLGLMVSWSDESIRRLFYETNVFSENQIDYLLNAKALQDKWTLALKIAFCKAYNLIPINNETCRGITDSSREFRNLDGDLFLKYKSVKNLIENFLIPAFNIRNKVQHGEWISAFEPPNSKIYDRELSKKIFKENIVTISSRMTIFNSVYQMIIDLSAFNTGLFKIDQNTTPFEYFYNLHIKKVEFEIAKINKPNLNEYINELIVKTEKGKMYKHKNLNL